ncbi:rhomboid family intramembrane serine protease [Acinetobacter stercoris]|uniref:Rhomboid protease AarA n=1 Tax=Acinetobacter stercoris TaxID=2126983 RepID=A0A2U3MXX7_9GAMM|nr:MULTISPECIES: rhomboid family intramembrane serine protease [Acinetobacter]SPL70213.1 Rhomboid protease AarA [Acinetobacter stercoris]
MAEYNPPPVYTQSSFKIGKITALFIAINVGLFVLEIFSGVNISNPQIVDALRWGADYAPLTYLEEPYRIFSSMFFHFGLIHLMMNMWALYVFGNIAEVLFGRLYFFGLYLLAGISGSLLSGYIDIQHSYELLQNFSPDLLPKVGAGASGAVMGIGGALTALSFFSPLPHQRLLLDKKSLITIMVINLAFGMLASGINNAAHVGGMIMGAVLAIAWYYVERKKMGMLSRIIILIAAIIATYFIYLYLMKLVQPIAPVWQEIWVQMKDQLGM